MGPLESCVSLDQVPFGKMPVFISLSTCVSDNSPASMANVINFLSLNSELNLWSDEFWHEPINTRW